MSLYRFALLWLVGTNLLAIVLTVSDKFRAKKGKWRVCGGRLVSSSYNLLA